MTAMCFTCKTMPAGNDYAGPYSAYCAECQVKPEYLGRFSAPVNIGPRGTRMCQCPVCLELFSGESTFVLHRIESERPPPLPGERRLGECHYPASKGMKLNEYGVWVLPLPAGSRLRA